jgi:hypothetical protein
MPDSDAIYHLLFSHPLMVEHLIRGFVPEAMAADLDFGGMARVNAKGHAESLDGKAHRREGDVIWRLPTHGGLDLYLYILLEFQSSIDHWMVVRTQLYEGLLWQQVIKEQELKLGDKLPPLVMVVLYNGKTRWNAPDDSASLVALPPGSPLWPYQPRVRYHVLDMGAVTTEPAADRDNMARLLFLLEQHHPPAALADLLGDVVEWFQQHPDHDPLRRLFNAMVHQAVAGLGVAVPIPEDLTEVRTMLATLGETWKQEWLAEGELKGKIEGKAEGKAEGRIEAKIETLMLLAERRFGPLSSDLRERIKAADPATVEGWLDRLLEATSLASLFGPTN